MAIYQRNQYMNVKASPKEGDMVTYLGDDRELSGIWTVVNVKDKGKLSYIQSTKTSCIHKMPTRRLLYLGCPVKLREGDIVKITTDDVNKYRITELLINGDVKVVPVDGDIVMPVMKTDVIFCKHTKTMKELKSEKEKTPLGGKMKEDPVITRTFSFPPVVYPDTK